MRRQLTTLTSALALLALLPGLALSDPPPGYYDSVDASSAAALRTTLHEVINDHVRYPYTSGSTDTWDILESADEDPNNPSNILDLYKNASIAKFGGGNGPYNREHSWPNSFGFPDDGSTNYPYTDCHHLFLCDVSYNRSRGSRPFEPGDAGCAERPTQINNGQGGGTGVYPGNSNWVGATDGAYGSWETWIGRRGDVARAQFYMDVRYEGGTHGGTGAAEPDLILTDDRALIAAGATGNNESVAYMGLASVLYQWHIEDPVDDLERHRNDVVYSYQGNRNPYIDHPEWIAVLLAVAAPPAAAPRIALQQNYPNPFNPRTTIAFAIDRPGPVRLAVYTVAGRRVATLIDAEVSAGRHEFTWDGRDELGDELGSGIYLYKLEDGDRILTKKMLLLE